MNTSSISPISSKTAGLTNTPLKNQFDSVFFGNIHPLEDEWKTIYSKDGTIIPDNSQPKKWPWVKRARLLQSLYKAPLCPFHNSVESLEASLRDPPVED